MATQSADGISWLVKLRGYKGETWNAIGGCSRKGPGCGGGRPGPLKGGCYAEANAIRMAGPGKKYEGLVRQTADGPRWTGEVRFFDDWLGDPLRWAQPRMVFADSMSDLFHEKMWPTILAAHYGVAMATPRHLYEFVTKRHEGVLEFFDWLQKNGGPMMCLEAARDWLPAGERRERLMVEQAMRRWESQPETAWPPPNICHLFSVSDQKTLEQTMATVDKLPRQVLRGLSMEPLLGPVDLAPYLFDEAGRPCEGCNERIRILHGAVTCGCCTESAEPADCRPPLDWIITGGESDNAFTEAAPSHPGWFRAVQGVCAEARVPYHHKQHGMYAEVGRGGAPQLAVALDGRYWVVDEVPHEVLVQHERHHLVWLRRFASKKEAGHHLDGKEYADFPAAWVEQVQAGQSQLGLGA